MYTSNITTIKDVGEFDKQYLSLRKEGFIWAVYLLANEADSADIYRRLIDDWTSIDAITGTDIVMVIANDTPALFDRRLKRVSSFNDSQQSRNIANANTTLSELATRHFGLSIMQWPCLVFVNLKDRNAQRIIVPLRSDTRMYDVMKYIMYRIKDLSKNLTTYINNLESFQNEQMYDDLTTKFRNAVLENNLCDDSIDTLLTDTRNSYNYRHLEQILQELHYRKIWLYGDSKKVSILSRMKSCQEKYPDFDARYTQYKAIQERILTINNMIVDIIHNIDVANCKEDAEKYALEILEHINEFDSPDAQLQESVSQLIAEMKKSISAQEVKEITLLNWKSAFQKLEALTTKIESNYAYRAFGVLSSFQTIIQLFSLII